LIANKRWFKEFASAYKERIGLPYRTNGRFECITEDIVDALKESGCVRMMFGLESGNEWVRKRLCNRGHSNDFILPKLRMVKAPAIETQTLNLIGFPFETKKLMRDTPRLNPPIGRHFGTTFSFNPYRGTELRAICARAGILRDKEKYINLTNNSVRPFI